MCCSLEKGMYLRRVLIKTTTTQRGSLPQTWSGGGMVDAKKEINFVSKCNTWRYAKA